MVGSGCDHQVLFLWLLLFTFFFPRSSEMASARLPVVHSPLSLLHNPPHEILSGCIQPYFESPERYHRILNPLLEDAETYEDLKLDLSRQTIDSADLRKSISRVHDEDYLDFLREIYDEWIAEGGSKVR